MKILLSSPPAKSFSFDTHLPIGTWCFVGNEDIENWKSFSFPEDPFVKAEDWIQFEKDCALIIKNVLPEVIAELNSKNDLSKTKHFWWIMVGHWLTSLVVSVALRSLQLRKAAEAFKTSGIEVDIKTTNTPFQFVTSNQFVYEGINNSEFNDWIFSELLLQDNFGWKLNINSSEFKFKTFTSPKYTWKYKLRLFFEDFLRFKRVYGTMLFHQILLTIPLTFSKRDQEKKNFLEQGPREDGVPTRFNKINWNRFIYLTMPESLKNIKEIDKKFSLIRKGRMIVCGTMLYANEDQKIKLANFVEGGGSLETVQHGCNYGYSVVHASLKFIESFNTNFITWGWKSHLDYNIHTTPLPAPLIQTLKNRFGSLRESSNKNFLYYVGRDPNPFVYWLYSCTQPNGLIKYFNKKIELLSKLSPNVLNNVLYRPAPNNPVSLSDTEFLKLKFKNLKLDTDGNIHEHLFKSKLVVCDTPGTTFHICMGANIPVIGVWNPNDYHTVPQAKVYISVIQKVGIIYDSHTKAAEFINSIFNNVDDWWESKDVQAARTFWADEYAKTSPNWIKDWFKHCMNQKKDPL